MALTGAGTASNPYLIYTVQDLVDTYGVNGIGVNFKLMNDLTLPFRDSRFPIPSFLGIFDGNGKKLSGLDIYLTTTDYVGLFGYISEATFKNLIVNSCTVTGRSRVGFFAGESYTNVVFENVWVGGYTFIQTYSQYSGTFHTAGAFIGYAYYPITFKNCHNKDAVVKAYQTAGGFIGNGAGGSVYDQCYSYMMNGQPYATSGGVGAFGNLNMTANASTSYYNDSGVGVTDWYSSATLLTDAQFKDQTAMPKFDWANNWGMNTNFNNGYPMPKALLPVLSPPNIFTIHKVSYIKTLASKIAWVNVVHPLIKAIHINSHIQPLSTAYTISVMEVVDKHIKAIAKLNNVSTEVKRLQLEKAISNIVSHLNQITGHLVITKDIKQFVFDNLASLLESGNDISFMQYLINEVYINESRHLTTNLQSKTEVTVVAFTGHTVTLKVNFKTYDNVAIEPTDVKVKIYKPTSTTYELISTISLSEANKTGIGQYEYLYTVPETLLNNSSTNFLVYEFSGLYNGQATLARGKFSIRFV